MDLDIGELTAFLEGFAHQMLEWATSPQFYAQCGLITMAVLSAYLLAAWLRKHLAYLRESSRDQEDTPFRRGLRGLQDLLFPVLNILALAFTVDLSELLVKQSALVRVCQSIAVLFMIYSLINHFVRKRLMRTLVLWTAIPLSMLHIFGLLGSVVAYLESISIEIGNIDISAYGVLRVLIFGSLLFWLGRVSNTAGQTIIRKQEDLDVGTREVFAKLFEVVLFILVALLLLQVMGINLTTLAVFGGALGVGLGFGLQSVASNFISGIILLLERSLTVGDYIELEDGRCGTIRELNMRSTTLETFDGKDIMVPNERFMTSTFVNWTHKNKKQRYALDFQVAYDTDLELLFKVVREVVASHPSVLSGTGIPIEERPDAEIKGFADSGIDILVEFWMEGIDDGKNRVGADLLLMIWMALKEHDISIPFPQREVRILGDAAESTKIES